MTAADGSRFWEDDCPQSVDCCALLACWKGCEWGAFLAHERLCGVALPVDDRCIGVKGRAPNLGVEQMALRRVLLELEWKPWRGSEGGLYGSCK
eukprot:5678112-Prorocentrum_lima.AAC.1